MVGEGIYFHLKFVIKVTAQSANFDQYNVWNLRASEKEFNYRKQEVDHALSNEL